MREKSMKLLVTFHTTAGAMAMEKYCKAQEAPGRLIPVPRSITADCAGWHLRMPDPSWRLWWRSISWMWKDFMRSWCNHG